MARSLTFTRSRTFPFPPEQAFDFTILSPLPELFSRWFGPLPPVVSVDGPETWGTAGLARTVHTADGSSMHEELLTVEAPKEFTYQLGAFTGVLGWLLSSVDGAWGFEPVGTGTRIEWSWTLHPASDRVTIVMPYVGRLWRGYARQSLDRLEHLMVTGLA